MIVLRWGGNRKTRRRVGWKDEKDWKKKKV